MNIHIYSCAHLFCAHILVCCVFTVSARILHVVYLLLVPTFVHWYLTLVPTYCLLASHIGIESGQGCSGLLQGNACRIYYIFTPVPAYCTYCPLIGSVGLFRSQVEFRSVSFAQAGHAYSLVSAPPVLAIMHWLAVSTPPYVSCGFTPPLVIAHLL